MKSIFGCFKDRDRENILSPLAVSDLPGSVWRAQQCFVSPSRTWVTNMEVNLRLVVKHYLSHEVFAKDYNRTV